MPYLMGIDIGSTSLKAVVYDQDGNPVGSGSSPTVLTHPDPAHPQWAVWEPDDIWNGVKSAVREALLKSGRAGDVKALAVTGFGYDGVPIDKNGECLYPFISWHCPRTQPQLETLVDRVGADRIFAISGRIPSPMNSIYRMMWLRDNRPDLLDRTRTWLLIEDWVNFRLSGAVATDRSMASCTSVMDLRTLAWSDELIGAAGIDIGLFPEIRTSGTVLGRVSRKAAEETGLSETTAVVLGGHDYHCAALPAGLFDDGVILNVAGTWEMILSASKTPILDRNVFESGIVVESHVAKDTFALMGAEVSGGILEWFRETFAVEETERARESGGNVWTPLMDMAAESRCGSNGVFLLPNFSGRSCIALDPKSLGAFVGLSSTVTKGDLMRAVVEGLNYQFREMLLCMERILGRRYERILSVGGVTKNAFLMQNKANVTGRVIEAPAVEEATPLGAAILAGIGTGVYGDEREAFERMFRHGTTYYPDPGEAARYDTYYEIYRGLYPVLKETNSKIFGAFRL